MCRRKQRFGRRCWFFSNFWWSHQRLCELSSTCEPWFPLWCQHPDSSFVLAQYINSTSEKSLCVSFVDSKSGVRFTLCKAVLSVKEKAVVHKSDSCAGSKLFWVLGICSIWKWVSAGSRSNWWQSSAAVTDAATKWPAEAVWLFLMAVLFTVSLGGCTYVAYFCTKLNVKSFEKFFEVKEF